tara:strand:- start:40545 stop:40826 length:282 start_codon:yes stop_codon:yes gene_type:complete
MTTHEGQGARGPEIDMTCLFAEEFRPECGCPQEHWHVHDGYCLDIHFEPDGTAHAVLLVEEDDFETDIEAADMDEARAKAFAWVDTRMTGDGA